MRRYFRWNDENRTTAPIEEGQTASNTILISLTQYDQIENDTTESGDKYGEDGCIVIETIVHGEVLTREEDEIRKIDALRLKRSNA